MHLMGWQCNSFKANNLPALPLVLWEGLLWVMQEVGSALLALHLWKCFVNWRKIWNYYGKYVWSRRAPHSPHWLWPLVASQQGADEPKPHISEWYWRVFHSEEFTGPQQRCGSDGLQLHTSAHLLQCSHQEAFLTHLWSWLVGGAEHEEVVSSHWSQLTGVIRCVHHLGRPMPKAWSQPN